MWSLNRINRRAVIVYEWSKGRTDIAYEWSERRNDTVYEWSERRTGAVFRLWFSIVRSGGFF